MKFRILALAAIVGCALGATNATARESQELSSQQNSVTSATNLRAPIPSGTRLSNLIADNPGNIALDTMIAASKGNRTKKDPSTDPTTYSDLTFTELNPCRIFDSRVTQGGGGPFVNGVSRVIKIGPYPAAGGGYATGAGAQGGSVTGCGLDTLAAAGEIDAVMVAVSSFNQTAQGYLTFYSATAPDPSASVVSVFYQPGAIRTAFVVMPTDALAAAAVSSRGISRTANTEVTLDIVGYFAKPHALALDCVDVGTPLTTIAAGASFALASPACGAGYTVAGPEFASTSSSNLLVVNGFFISGGTYSCQGTNATAGPVDVACGARCCRVPGR